MSTGEAVFADTSRRVAESLPLVRGWSSIVKLRPGDEQPVCACRMLAERSPNCAVCTCSTVDRRQLDT